MSAHFEKDADRIQPDIRSNKAPPLGVGRVLSQVRQDLFGTKDVQDAITASYVWLEDQAGHIALGFVLTLLPCSIANLISSETSPWRDLVFLGIATLVCVIGVLKEEFDKKNQVDPEEQKKELASEEGTFKAVFLLLLLSKFNLVSCVVAAGLAYKLCSNA